MTQQQMKNIEFREYPNPDEDAPTVIKLVTTNNSFCKGGRNSVTFNCLINI